MSVYIHIPTSKALWAFAKMYSDYYLKSNNFLYSFIVYKASSLQSLEKLAFSKHLAYLFKWTSSR